MSKSFPPEVHAARRQRLLERLGDDAVAVVAAGELTYRNRDVSFDFRPDGDFSYLTGFAEPGSVAVVTPLHPEHRFVLFVPPRDPVRERWDGPRAGVEGAVERFAADAAFPLAEIAERLPAYLEGARRLVAPLGRRGDLDRALIDWLAAFTPHPSRERPGPEQIVDAETVIGELRLVKGDEEIDRLRRSAAVAAAGHRAAWEIARPGVCEGRVAAEIEAVFLRQGARGVAFSTIVASGPNAGVLHHTRNDRTIADGDLVLVDAGAEVDDYVSDLTRTFPASGTFSPPQRRIYDLVLAARRSVLERVRPGTSWDELQATAVATIVDGLIDLGLLVGPAADRIEDGTYKAFYPHSIGHWIGVELRDAGRYRSGRGWRSLAPGMVFTVEPGVYVPAAAAVEEYREIGVRIEDAVVVSADGWENLTADLPVAADEVERAIVAARQGR
ncbi:MAG TPA: aminopeptidase P N-terminal domain-containing protein [Thermoanaerobaculia bacterium]|nr:aminopeptidase P N-terminal domain-containing protein [Thermoanaerobaculia bacterium]